jgi:hypothetical protein
VFSICKAVTTGKNRHIKKSGNNTSADGLPFYCCGITHDQITGQASENLKKLCWEYIDVKTEAG